MEWYGENIFFYERTKGSAWIGSDIDKLFFYDLQFLVNRHSFIGYLDVVNFDMIIELAGFV